MDTQTMKATDTLPKASTLSLFFKKLGAKIANLFEPEEVEVTFKVEGEKIRYTYTVIEHKQVA